MIGLVLGWFLLPRGRSCRPVGRGDRLGAVLLALAAAGPLLYLSLADHAGSTNPLLLLVLVGGAARERSVAQQLIDLSIFRRRALSVGLSDVDRCRGMWNLPDGTVRFGERLVEAVGRVAADELGVSVPVGPLLGYIE